MTVAVRAAGALKAATAALRCGAARDAGRLVRPVLIHDPAHADATILAAMAARSTGDIPTAARRYARALALSPSHPYARAGADELHAAPALVEADLLERARLRPGEADRWSAVGWRALASGNRVLAWTALRRACVLAPGDRTAVPMRILAERRGSGRTDWSALGGRAVVVDPAAAGALSAALVAYREARNATGVSRVSRRLVTLAGGSMEVYQAMVAAADVAIRSRDVALARRWTKRAASMFPGAMGHAELWAGLLRAEGRRDDAVRYLRGRVADRPDDPSAAGLMFDLASVLDEDGDRAAVPALALANRAARIRAARDGVDRRRFLELLTRLEAVPCAPEPLLEQETAAPAPVFLFGMPRSGTTLIGDLLGRHPMVETFDEVDLLPDMIGIEGARRRRAGGQGDVAEVIAGRQPFLPGEAAAMRATFRRLAARHERLPDRPVKVDKSPFGFLYAGVASRLFADAPFVFAVRHPADVCLSCLMQDFASTDALASFTSVAETAELYDRVMTFWTRASQTLAIRQHTVRYEALATDPEGEMRRLVAFLGLAWEPGVLDLARSAGRYTATPSFRQVARPIDGRAIGRWRRYRDFLAPGWDHLLPWIRRLGYEES